MKMKLALCALAVVVIPIALALAGTRSKVTIIQVKNTGEAKATVIGQVQSSDECTPQRKVKVFGIHGHGGSYFLGATKTNKKGKFTEDLEGNVQGEQLLEANFPQYTVELTRRKFESGGERINCGPDEDTFTLKRPSMRATHVVSKTSLNLGPRPGEFTGVVTADDPGCVSGRKIVVFRLETDGKEKVAKDFSDINGLWGKVTDERSGTWFAKLKPDKRGNLHCLGDKSPKRSAG